MKFRTAILLLWILVLAACTSKEGPSPARQPDQTYQPDIRIADFPESTTFTHPYFPYQQGSTYIYGGQSDEGTVRIELERTAVTRIIMGIICSGIQDKTWIAGQLLEESLDWYAQDKEGNIWFMGQELTNYNSDGIIINHNGSWEAGVHGVKPGIVMPAHPQPGLVYREEYFFNVAEDQAEIIAIDMTIAIPLGTFENCLKIKGWTELDQEVLEYKYYAPGKGIIQELSVKENEEIVLGEIKN